MTAVLLMICLAGRAESGRSQTAAIDVCGQHPPKCPLDEKAWPGEAGGWQYTGKKWRWYPRSARYKNRIIVWEWSAPYMGENPDYAGDREDHYADFTAQPDAVPIDLGRKSKTYDWERWRQEPGNYRMMQIGNAPEKKSYLVGESDCDSGMYYPVVDELNPYFYSAMFSTRFGKCTGGGYISAQLAENWGDPLTQKRIRACDNRKTGIPAEYSPVGNIVCKISPQVGLVYQRYVFGPEREGQRANYGCEAVLYAWGWTEPENPATPQDYQAWFRNGELRFTRWHDLTKRVSSSNPPAPDDHEWWNANCAGAWDQAANWLYTGDFMAGSQVYSDQAQLPPMTIAQIPAEGGGFAFREAGVEYFFPAGAFTEAALLTVVQPAAVETPGAGTRVPASRPFQAIVEYQNREAEVALQQPYQVRVFYDENLRGATAEAQLGLYFWNGLRWEREFTSSVDVEANTVTAYPLHFSLWVVMGEPYRIYLPRLPFKNR
ncbi:MAG: hypothetical protein L0Z70_05105 [Chloroflexi bacterium]|nr:hypothetical protein [Chloroflexota bacterium]